MRLLRAATVLALLLSPLHAGYVVEWTAPLNNPYGCYWAGKPTISDVDGDSIPDLFVDDSSSLKIYSGVSHNLIWTIPTPSRPRMDQYGTPVVTNTDGDPQNELVFITVGDPERLFIYDCATETLEFSPSQEGFESCPPTDLDGDGKAEICFQADSNPLLLEVYGWAAGVSEYPPSSPSTGRVKASPTPTRRSVSFTLPASAGPGSIAIVDATGRNVRTLSASALPGPRKIEWDCLDNAGSPVPAGTYIYRLAKTSGKLEVVR